MSVSIAEKNLYSYWF